MKKKTYILAFLMMLCSFVFGQGCPWTQPSNYEYTMTVSGRVLIQGEWVMGDDASRYTLGAFCGNQLRGVIPVSEFNTGTQITIGGEEGQSITFKLWDGDALSVLEYSGDPVKFVTNDIITMFDINFTGKNHWNPAHNTNSNMTVTAKVTINGANVNGDYEIGAFIGDNVCGSARVNNSLAYIVISHNEEDGDAKVTFKLWNHGEGELAEEITDVTVNYEHNATYGSQENPFVINFNNAVAKVGDKNFATLQAAVNATTEENTEVTILRSFVLDNTVTIAENQTVVLNLDGKTISQEKACTASYSMIENKGNLTIEGNGKISFKDTGDGDPNFYWGSYTIYNRGTLVVTNGTIEHTGEQTFAKHMICAIQQGAGSTTITDGTFSTPNYRSVRINGGSLTVNNGKFDGQVWLQPNQSNVTIAVNGGTFEPNGNDASSIFMTNNGERYTVTETSIIAGTFNGKIGASDATKEGVKGSISGGTFSATAKNGTNEALLAEGYIFEQNQNGTYSVVPGLKGSGTEDDPFIIMTLNDLTFFRDHVNGGGTKYNATGKWVALGANIDMEDVDWSVNIGDDCNATFDGIFDGKDFTLSNLNSTETAQKADGYICTGLFGAIAGNAVVKNFTIENVTINTGNFKGNNVSAVVGFAYKATGSIENVKVIGDINISAPEVTGVGAIVGYDYYSPSLKIENCSVIGNNGSAIVAKSYVGGLVGYASSKIALNENTVKNVSVTGTASVGAIAGIMLGGSSANANIVKYVNLSTTGELWANSAAVVAGTITGGGVTVENTTVENVIANGTAASIVGGVLVEKPTTPIVKVPAKNENVYYTTHIAALSAQGDNVTFFVPYTVEAGETLTIDKNVTYSSNVLGEAMITNKGTLTITGSVDYTYTGQPDATYGKGNYTINNSGTLTVKGVNGVNGEVVNNTDKMSHASYAINTNAGATLNVEEGGKVLNSNGHAIRMVSFGTAANNVNINGGYIEGTRALQVQLPSGSTSTAKPEMNLAISGGELKSNEETYNLAVYVYSNGQSAENLNIDITGGTFNGNVAINAAATQTMKQGSVEVEGGTFNGQWGVFSYAEDTNNTIAITGGVFKTNYSEMYAENDGCIFVWNETDKYYHVITDQYVAKIGDDRYTKLQAAIDACVEGENTITLLANIDEDVTVVQAPNTKVTINGANKKYTGTITVDGKSEAYETAALTITDVNFDASNITKDASINLGGSNATRYTSNVTVEKCSFIGTYKDNGQEKVGIKNYTGGCQNLTVTECSANGLHSLVQVKGVTGENGLTVDNVEITNCKNGIAVGTSTKVIINDSEIVAEEYGVRADGEGAYNMTLEGNTITANLPVVVRKATGAYELTVEGGSYIAKNNDGYVVTYTKGDDGTFEAPTGDAKATISINGGVKSFGFVAKNGNQFYTLFADAAVKDVKHGETIELLSDVTLVGGYDEAADGLRIEKAVNATSGYEAYTIDGKGHTINCGGFEKGIRVYNDNGNYAANAQVVFKNVTIINDNAKGRCIDTRTANIYLELNNVKLIAEGTNSQPLTIGGDEATYRVNMVSTTINAGVSGYGVICFVPVQAGITASSNTNISGFAAFYIKNNACTTNINLGHGTYVGTNLFSKASGDFGTIVVEGSKNNINLTIDSATVKAVAGDNTAAQAAFAIRGANNKINIQTEGAQVVTEGEKAFWAMIYDNVAESTKIIDNGTDLYPVAKCGGYHFMSLEEAYRFAEENSTITLVRDIELAEIFAIEKSITLDLGGKKVTSTAKKAFEVYANATIKNGTIYGAERAVDTRKAVTLSLADVALATTATGVNTQPLTIGGSENGTKVNMTKVNINAGTSGYGIISFVETELTATESTIEGYSALYVKPGSEGSSFNFVKSTLSGSTADNDVEGNSFSTIALRADNVTVTVDAESTVKSSGNYCHAISLGGNYAGEETTEGNNVTIAGTISGNILSSKCINDNTVKINKEYADELKAEGFATVAIEGTNLVLVVGKAIAEVNDTYYATLDAAAKAANGAEINIIRDFTENYTVADGAVVNIDFNGHKMNGYILAPNAVLTIANGAIVNDVDEDYSTIEIKAGKLNLNDVKMSSKRHAVRIEGAVEAIINGGEYTLIEKIGRTQHVLNVSGAANVTINGGKFVGPKGTAADSGSAINVQSGAEVTIYDGFYSGGKSKTLASAGELVIYGGKYDQDPTAYIAEKYTVIETTIENVKWHEVVKAEAKIGETLYATLQGAVDAAQDGETVVIVDDFTVTETVVVSGEKNITLDLDDMTVTGSGSEAMPVIRIQDDANVTVKNGSITNNDGYIFILGASDSSSFGNLTIVDGTYHGATSVASVTLGTLTVLDGEFSVEPYQGSYEYLINCIDKNYTDGFAKVEIKGGYFHNWNPENNAAEGEGTNFCAIGYEAVTFDGENYFVFEKDTTVQSTSLTAGWTWTSFFVDATFDALKVELGTNGRQIKTQASGFTSYNVNTNAWNGGLKTISADLMYMIKVENAQVINLEAYPVDPSDYEYDLHPNWTWISFPFANSISVTEALADVNPVVGDRIKGQGGFAQYTSSGKWQGGLKTLEPGKGYMYQNSTSEIKTLVYPETNGNRGEAYANITAANNLMVPNMTKYANNMNITAVVNIDGEELMTEDFEVAVFAGKELRGSARPIYIEDIDRYMLFITVYGEENEELTFKYYDLNSGEELNLFADSKVVFEINSVIGSVEQPSVLNYGTLSIDETSASSFNVYPNPVNRDNAISFETTFDKVEVYNSLGVVVAGYANVDKIDGIETAGIYVIKVKNDNVVKYCRVIVK